jgi:glycogen debranching enzyme
MMPFMNHLDLPFLQTKNKIVNNAFRIAIGDLLGNILPFQDGLLDKPFPCLMAGLEYNTPWTRDAAINTWNGAGLLFPEVTENTLKSVLGRADGKIRIAGQYWDAIIWTIGAWQQYLFTGDKEFLNLALQAVRNSLEYFETTEFDKSLNLFRGPACYGDGVAAYPDIYTQTKGSSSILDWPECNPDKRAKSGYGIPMHALSTNCLYYQAYVLAQTMAQELGVSPVHEWFEKSKALRSSILSRFWNPQKGTFNYLVDDFGGSDYQEGMGHAFVLLFGIADKSQSESVLRHQTITPAGIPCVWPSFPRYDDTMGGSFGRHCGTVWPHIQAFYADAALKFGKTTLFEHEIFTLAEHAWRDSQFTEIYNPETCEPYGGMQEDKGKGIRLWKTCKRQTWSATGFLRMTIFGLAGMTFESRGIRFNPHVPEKCGFVRLSNIRYRNMTIDLSITGQGLATKSFKINGQEKPGLFLDASLEGHQTVDIVLK